MKGSRVNKEAYIIKQLAPDSRVLHVGCTNSPSTLKRWESKTLLHKKLCDRAKDIGASVIGIDIDDEAIDFLKNKMADEEILNVDAHKLADFFAEDRKFDLIIAGDVIEHLPNPGLFLEACAKVLAPDGEIIITSANAFSIVRFLKAIFFHEAVHTEHTAYYSHKTIKRLLDMSNLEGKNFAYYKCEALSGSYSINRSVSNLIENTTCIIFPQFSEGIVVIASLKK